MKTLIFASVGLALALLLYTSTATAISNGSFETGDASGWSLVGDALVTNDPAFGSTPTDGSFHLLFTNLPNGVPDAGAPLGAQGPYSGTDAVTAAALETFFNVGTGYLTGLSPSTNPAIHGSGASVNFSASAGHNLTFDYDFLTNEPTPTANFTDFLFYAVIPQGDTVPVLQGVLADTNASAFAASPATDFNEETGYTNTGNLTIPATGDYRLVLGVVDVNDQNFTSGALVDNFLLTPEPSAGLLLGVGLAWMSMAARRRTRTR